ncbi:hypothetical protein V8E36_007642 [Tilletia maclaganii]
MSRHPGLHGQEGSACRLSVTSLMLANKWWDDHTYLNKTWSELSGIELRTSPKCQRHDGAEGGRLVGLITFGTITQTQQLGHDPCPNSSVFRGTKEYAPKQIQEMLGLTAAAAANVPRPDAQKTFFNTGARFRRFVTPGPGLSSRAHPLSPGY